MTNSGVYVGKNRKMIIVFRSKRARENDVAEEEIVNPLVS